MDNHTQVTSLDLGWLVGIIDGEGMVELHSRYRTKNSLDLRPTIQVSNCDKAIIDRAAGIIKSLGVGCFVSYNRGDTTRRENWTIVVQGLKRTAVFLPIITPHLTGEKRVKAKLLQEFVTIRLGDWHAAPFTARQLEIYASIRALNARGRKARNLRDYTPNSYSTKLRFKVVEDIVQTTTI